LELVSGGSEGIAVIDEGDAVRSRDVAVLPICPHAHEELDVVQGPGAALEVSVSTVKWWGEGSCHADVPLVVGVEVSADGEDVVRAASVARQRQTSVMT